MQDLRKDWRASVLAVAEVLAHTARSDATSAPTWEVLVARSGRSRRTVCRVVAWLRAAQLLVTLENGSTPQFRPRPRPQRGRPSPVEVEGNRAAVYLLTEPLPDLDETDDVAQVDQRQAQSEHYGANQSEHYASPQIRDLEKTGSPSWLLQKPGKTSTPHGRARETCEDATANFGARSTAALSGGGLGCRDHLASAGTNAGYRRGLRGTKGTQRAIDLAVAEALRARSLDLRALSAKAIRSAVRSQLADGWGVEDLVRGIDHAPDGTPRTYTAGPAAAGAGPVAAEVDAERRRRGVVADGSARQARAIASPRGWLAWRLADWAGLPPPVATRHAEAAARSAAVRTAAAARRAAAAAAAAAAVPPPPVLAEARAALRARRTGA